MLPHSLTSLTHSLTHCLHYSLHSLTSLTHFTHFTHSLTSFHTYPTLPPSHPQLTSYPIVQIHCSHPPSPNDDSWALIDSAGADAGSLYLTPDEAELVPPADFHIVKFYRPDLGLWERVVVDDFFPVNPGSNVPKYSRSQDPELWVMIVEKAYAKVRAAASILLI